MVPEGSSEAMREWLGERADQPAIFAEQITEFFDIACTSWRCSPEYIKTWLELRFFIAPNPDGTIWPDKEVLWEMMNRPQKYRYQAKKAGEVFILGTNIEKDPSQKELFPQMEASINAFLKEHQDESKRDLFTDWLCQFAEQALLDLDSRMQKGQEHWIKTCFEALAEACVDPQAFDELQQEFQNDPDIPTDEDLEEVWEDVEGKREKRLTLFEKTREKRRKEREDKN